MTALKIHDVALDDGRPVVIRDLRPDDAALYPEFSAIVSAEDVRLRFHGPLSTLSDARVRALTQYDPADARASIAIDPETGAMLGVGRVHRDGPASGEFAVIVRSDLKGRGLGHALLEDVIRNAGELGLVTLWGLIQRGNAGMIALARDLGFELGSVPSDASLVLARRPVGRHVPADA